jgi:hypothetical protein
MLKLYAMPSVVFNSEQEMCDWLASKGVDLALADSGKGLKKLFNKIKKGEARLVYDESSGRVYRPARVARIEVEATLEGKLVPLVELCQIFLVEKMDPSTLKVLEADQIEALVATLAVRSSHVRSSNEMWETLIGSEDATMGARRGIKEELGITEEEAAEALLTEVSTVVEYEPPIDWPGIHSVLETHNYAAVLPASISKPVYAEVEEGDQLTFFVPAQSAAALRERVRKIIPNLRFLD